MTLGTSKHAGQKPFILLRTCFRSSGGNITTNVWLIRAFAPKFLTVFLKSISLSMLIPKTKNFHHASLLISFYFISVIILYFIISSLYFIIFWSQYISNRIAKKAECKPSQCKQLTIVLYIPVTTPNETAAKPRYRGPESSFLFTLIL